MNESRSIPVAMSLPAPVSRVRERVSLLPGACGPSSGCSALLSGSRQPSSGSLRVSAGVLSASFRVGARLSLARVSSSPGWCVSLSGACQQPSGFVQHSSRSLRVALRVGARRGLGRCVLDSGLVRVLLPVASAERSSASFYSVATPSRLFFHVSPESNRTPNHALQRTAPRVTVAAISSSCPSRPSHLFL